MKHFVQYHNSDVMGPFRPSQKTFGIVTDKRAGLREGDMVWLITGEGRPRHYFLCETFVAEKITPQTAQKFRYRVSSTDGKALYPLKVDKSSGLVSRALTDHRQFPIRFAAYFEQGGY